MIDIALPNNRIPRVFMNTGLEFNDIVKFVKSLAEHDDRFAILLPGKNIVKTLEEVGYPFKSKEHSLKVGRYQKGSRAKSILYYKNSQGISKYACPISLLYQYEDNFTLKISDRCCYEFKKIPIKSWQLENKKKIVITGMRSEEGGQRENMTCTVFSKGELVKFHPLAIVSEKWEEWFIKEYDIQLCKLYYPPYSFERTGCVGCPFNIKIKKELKVLKKLLPKEYKRSYLYFGKVYDEYKRINYRL